MPALANQRLAVFFPEAAAFFGALFFTALFFAGAFAGTFLAVDLAAAFGAAFFPLGEEARLEPAALAAVLSSAPAAALPRTARVFSASAAFSSPSNSSGVNGRADLRRRSM